MTEPQWQNPTDPTAPPAWSPPAWGGQTAADPYASPPNPAAPAYGQTPYAAPAYGSPAYGQPSSDYGQPNTGYGQPGTGYGQYGQTPYGGYQSPYGPPPKRTGRTVLIVVLVLVVVAGLCVGGVVLFANNSTKAKANGPTAGPPTTGASTGTHTSGPTDPGQALFAKIVAPPAGSHDFVLDKGVNGVFTAKQLVAQTFTSSTAAGRLTTAGFVTAAGRDYERPDGLEIVVYLIQFTKPDGATSIYKYVLSGRDSDNTVTSKFAVPDGKGYNWNKLDKLGNRRSEMYKIVGNVLILLNVYTPGAIDNTTDLQFLSDQVNQLG